MHIVAECIRITVYLIGSQAKAQLTVMKNKHAVGSRDTFWTLSHHMQSMLWELMQQEEGCVPLKSSYSAVQTSTLSNLCVADKTFQNAMLLLSAALLQHHICCAFVAGGEEMMAVHLLMRLLILIHRLRRKCLSSSLLPPRPLWLNQCVSDASLWYRIYINGDTGWCHCVAACECYMLQCLTSSPKRMLYWPTGRSAVELKVYRNYYTIQTEGSNVYWYMVA